MAGVVYFLSYELALVFFAVAVGRLLRGNPLRRRHTLLLSLSYIGGMFYAAHGFYFAFVEGSLTNRGADRFWRWVADNREVLGTARGLGDAIWELFQSGGGLWGGPLFVLLLVTGLLVWVRLPLGHKQEMADAAAVALPFSLAICKVGCFAVGCCHGFRGRGALFITNTWGQRSLACHDTSCFPTQPLDLFNYLLIGVMLVVLHRRGQHRGVLLPWFVLFFAVLRFGTELSRGDHVGPTLAGLTLVQLVLVVAFAAALALVLGSGLFDRLLAARSMASPPAGVATERERERASLRYVTLVVGSHVVTVPLLLFPPVFGVLLVRDLLAPPLSLPRRLSDLSHHAACLGLGMLWLTAFVIRSLVPFLAVAALTSAVLAVLFDGYYSSTSERVS
jgi:prolipoprotein diacylglyceryltransferase